MALGYHCFYAFSLAEQFHIVKGNRMDYFMGTYCGDTYADPEFKTMLDRVRDRLRKKFGIGGYTYCWSPFQEKPYRPRTDEQRYKTAVKKTVNKYNKKVKEIILDNTLFVEAFIQEAQTKLDSRIAVLTKRYGIASND
jgi:hypothetical protein